MRACVTCLELKSSDSGPGFVSMCSVPVLSCKQAGYLSILTATGREFL